MNKPDMLQPAPPIATPAWFSFKNISIGLITGWMMIFVFLPNLMIIGTSFMTRDSANLIELTFTLDNYKRLMDPLYFKVLFHSIYMASMATLICLLIGYPFAYYLCQLPKKWQPFLLFLVIVPFWTNSLIRTYAIKILLANRGLLNSTLMDLGLIEKPLKMMYTEFAVIFALVYVLLPFMIMPLYTSIDKLRRDHLEAARDLGASPLQSFRHIILPMTLPGIIAGCLLVFLPAMGMFYVSDLVGGARNLLIGNVIKTQFLNVRDWPFGAAASIALTVLMGLLIYIYYRAGQFISRKESAND